MKYLVSYATTQGHTRQIARRAADTLFDAGHTVELMPLADGDARPLQDFDAVLLLASIHSGHYQGALSDFAAAQKKRLDQIPSMFISVSLAAAGHDDDDWRSLDRIAAELSEATGWHPSRVLHLAGAYKPSAYDVVTAFFMRRIIARKDPSADLKADKVYTDWDTLQVAVLEWAASIQS
ncbi:flavodoxin domain-containing protein [Thalassococcus lentus]|uniref:Protoporphyrinogen oxidase n=1 Tax=Thalassococcus lentus TaxID=1210524 RepID=A0ABT4XRJ8_9RHOB|nr:flavodoxin domain-containing protein [Thalassococcus lentus]MDA7424582.1 protoporphyrinogen oxidase [Thalassococcus lentus]